MSYVLYCLAFLSIVIGKKFGFILLFQGIHILTVLFSTYSKKKNIVFIFVSMIIFTSLSIYMDDYQGGPIYIALIVILILKHKLYNLEEENRRLNNQLLLQYDRDNLSGLYTNKYIYEYLVKRLQHLDDQPLALLMMDIDNFRRINEKISYRYGDHVIRLVAEALEKVVEPEDVIGRYGGEEFVVIVNNGDIEKTVGLADKIRGAVHLLPLKQNIELTMSIGIAFYNTESADELIANAHDKLRAAKNLGNH